MDIILKILDYLIQIKSKKIMNATKVVENLKQRFPNEPEYIQAVSQVLGTIEEEYNKHPEFDKANLIERLCIHPRSRM